MMTATACPYTCFLFLFWLCHNQEQIMSLLFSREVLARQSFCFDCCCLWSCLEKLSW
uniref:Uncharacterized protein n=1 Tax=Arundo donax TaxID=35708 RepID=A0A0A9E6J5_ARUDO